jgi:hypothetical protein
MVFEYVGPANSDRDLLRFVAGDTDPARYLLEDADLDYLLTTYASVDGALIACLDAMIAKVAQRVGFMSGSESEQLQFQGRQLRELRADKVKQGYPEPRAGSGAGSSVLQFVRDEDPDEWT